MKEVVFIYEQEYFPIKCNENQKMKDICHHLSIKINIYLNLLVFLYGGNIINLEKKLNEITDENKIYVLVYKNENEICSKCGRILDNNIIDDILLLNDNINLSLIGIIGQIKNILDNNMNPKDINYVKGQLMNINLAMNNISEDAKKVNNKLNQIKNKYDIIKQNIINENNEINEFTNQILCIYNKNKDEINLLHDYNINIDKWKDKEKKLYLESKNNINECNVDIYINNKKIKFNYKYTSDERGDIQVKFIFKKFITNVGWMFWSCSSLKSIDLSLFNATNIKYMGFMFWECSSLESINLSSLNTSNVNDMGYMFYKCYSLNSLDLSSFNTDKVENMSYMFHHCHSLKSMDLSSFNTVNTKYMPGMFSNCFSLKSLDLSPFVTTNVRKMENMFSGCSSLESLDLSSFDVSNVSNISYLFKDCSSLESLDLTSFNLINAKKISGIFYGCSSLKRDKIKISDSSKKILDQLD